MQVTIRSDDLAAFAKDARRAGRKDLNKKVGQGMRALVKPIIPEVRAKVRSLPSGGNSERSKKARERRPRSLRDATARGVQSKVSLSGKFAGVRLRVDPRHFPPGEKNLPKLLEGAVDRWRHETYGHEPWVDQQAHPYFFPTIRPHIPRVQAGIRRALDDAVAELMRGGTP